MVLRMMIWSESPAGQNGVVVSVPDGPGLLEDIARRFAARQGFSVATLNLDHVVKLAHDADFRQAYAEHTHITADGNPIVWLSHLAGQRNVKLVPGSELIEPLAALAAEMDVPVALVGATDESLTSAAMELERRYPGLRVVLTLAPSMGFDPDGAEADQAIERIGETGARLVFLALGAPRQERFAARAQKRLGEAGFLSIGAGLDFVSGAQTRAPRWIRAMALEWLWRLLSNPRRLAARYGACILVLPRLTVRALAARGRS